MLKVATFESFTEGAQYHAEGAQQLSWPHTFHSQESQHVRHAEHHVDINYNVGDEVLFWTPAHFPSRSETRL